MANELRVRQNFIGGQIEDNPLSSSATTLTSAALAAVPAIGSTQHFPITLDVDGVFGEPEIAYVTAHTAAATTATILRAQEGTTARQHNQDIQWVHGPSTRDFTRSVNTWGTPGSLTGTAPSSPDFSPLIQAGSSVLTPSGSGVFTISFHSPFPQALISVVANFGDLTPANAGFILISMTNVSLSSVQGIAYTTTGGYVSSICRINWFAMGC